jgi:ferritin-like metal-binding protein YciE
MQMQSLKDLFLDQLKDIYSAETQVTKALPKMVKAASATELRDAFKTHLDQTQTQIKRLEDSARIPKGRNARECRGSLKKGKN